MSQEQAKPIMDKIKEQLDFRVKTTLPQRLLGKAISYTLGQWEKVEAYLEDGRLQLIIMWLKTPPSLRHGAEELAFLWFSPRRKSKRNHLSFIVTAKACGLTPYEYLFYVFERLPYAKAEDDLKVLLPQAMSKNES